MKILWFNNVRNSMITFLPYSDFSKSASVLDKKRCWKQVIEARQIIDVLEGKTLAWKNHPAVKMWIGHTDLLKCYYNIFLYESKNVRKINTTLVYNPRYFSPFINNTKLPFWLGNENFHRSHRARLIEKNRDLYLPLFPKDEGFNGGKYLWPVIEEQTFRII